ncbi:hypothetical protein A3E15_00305 [Candidatus Woesebacteria bacterium RIFCSPHIGHO2_12_FULL_42_9]|uniref:Type II secretion system protein GspG C-terminal domain-containing protein n=3 Tax=Candidatus Woeseibacteriota TaxID=1752722 RepID=A0A1F8AXJ6_9BACT|nr:MAG: hypothetical protein A2112_00630 [Candidatus Woesebacteria bacterium GWA1_42_12]OGM06472.1 MAG: hypothetical protein A2129_02065 [Candidatus Woesebacteria bacterium GWC1_42_13]OGM56483.1 MAG: hypothetical protein A3E15_00305 [Candidatus Woesebacteria bacterium RIFCSPHIGHO2_12_FULL_42_9]
MTARFKGFTLVELLIVIAIIGVLAVVVLVAINPVEQLAKTRDSGRISTVTQVGHALQAYYTSHATQTNAWPGELTWSDDLTVSGELSTFPSGIGYPASFTVCAENDEPDGGTNIPTYCYDWDSTASDYGSIVYSRMESNNQNSKCGANMAFALFSTEDGRGGIVCSAGADLNPAAAGGWAYQ